MRVIMQNYKQYVLPVRGLEANCDHLGSVDCFLHGWFDDTVGNPFLASHRLTAGVPPRHNQRNRS